MTDSVTNPANAAKRPAARAILVGDRLTVDRTGHTGVISTAPFGYRKDDGYVIVFRYGAVVLIGLAQSVEQSVLGEIASGAQPLEEERVIIDVRADLDEGPSANGVLQLREMSAAHVLVLADILAKSVALARYEREIASVFDTIEPAAARLAVSGRLPKDRQALLRLIGAALLAQHRVSGRIAFAEKPEVLWEHPELERLYARLEDEFEIVERGTILNGKMMVLGSVAETFTDLMDTARSVRLELLVVILIVAELVIAAVTLFR